MKYNVIGLKKNEFIAIMQVAHSLCDNWWINRLDSNKSYFSQKIDNISFDDAIKYFKNNDAVPTCIERTRYDQRQYIDVGFHTLEKVSYTMYIIVNICNKEKLISLLKEKGIVIT